VPVAIVVDDLDQAIWTWVMMVLQNPRYGESWRVLPHSEPPDSVKLQALQEAGQRVTELEATLTGLAANLALLKGGAAQRVADQLNAMSDQLDDAIVERVRLARETAAVVVPEIPVVVAVDAIGQAAHAAIAAMRAAEGLEPGPLVAEDGTG
jgi:hypothetical protein